MVGLRRSPLPGPRASGMLPPMSASLAPGLLLAPPALLDANFFRSVVLLCAHTPEGAFGLILNHILDIEVAGICEEAGVAWPHDSSPPAYCGGPVERQRGWVLHDPIHTFADTQHIDEGIALSASKEALSAFAADPTGRFRLILGYAGWDAGQLDEELAAGGWLHAAFDPATHLDVDPRDLWRRCIESLGVRDLSQLVEGSTEVN